jgi:hypothetical protein
MRAGFVGDDNNEMQREAGKERDEDWATARGEVEIWRCQISIMAREFF